MRSLPLALALAALAVLAPAASARDQVVTSFDGTAIATSFFPATGLKAGEKAPGSASPAAWSPSTTRTTRAATPWR
jgi:ABC-2 type transport system ATP-binding protein